MYAAQTFASAGWSWEAILWDATQAINLLNTGLVQARRPTWIMSPANKAAVSFLPNAFGVPAFPGVAAQGLLAGAPIVTSQNVPNSIVLLIDCDMILHASDPNIRLDISREASVQADSDPATPPTGMISLWQQNMVGILGEQYVWWGRARDQAIVEITGVQWATAPAPLAAPISPTAAAAAAPVAKAPAAPPGSGRAR